MYVFYSKAFATDAKSGLREWPGDAVAEASIFRHWYDANVGIDRRLTSAD